MKRRKYRKSFEYESFLQKDGLVPIRAARSVVLKDFRILVKESYKDHDYKSVYYYQRLASLIFNSDFNFELFKSCAYNKKVGIAIPKELRTYFHTDFHISKIFSQIKYCKFLAKHIFKSLLKSLIFSLPSTTKRQIKEFNELKNKNYRLVMLNENMQDPNILEYGDDSLYTFTNWYKENNKGQKIVFIHQIKPAKKSNIHGYVYLRNIPLSHKEYLIFFLKAMRKYAGATIRTFRGDYRDLLCISEIILQLRYMMASTKVIPDVVVFNESNGIQKPLFAYTLESRGSQILYLPFSLSNVVNLSGQDTDFFPWQLSTWKNMQVYDKYQEEFLNRANPPIKVILHKTNKIPYYRDVKYEFRSKRFIALFDILPDSNYFGASTLNDIGSNSWTVWFEFMNSVVLAASDFNLDIYYKPKKSIFRFQESRNLIQELIQSKNFILVDERVSPHRLITRSKIVISSALTTPAFIAQQLGICSIVFSASNKLLDHDPSLRNLVVARNLAQLKSAIVSELSS